VIAPLSDSAQLIWKRGADLRVERAMGSQHKHWWGKIWHRVYDMGQNINLALQEMKARGDKEINWLALPGHEVCSTLVTSIEQCAFDNIQCSRWFLDKLQEAIAATGDKMEVRGTQDIDPAALWLLSDRFKKEDYLFRVLKPGDEVRPYSIIQFMSWAEPGERNMAQVIINLIVSPLNFMATFSRGIKVYQRQKNRPYPSYLTTHSVLTLPPDNKDIRYISQEALTFIKHFKVAELTTKMGGLQPRHFVLEPVFLYPEPSKKIAC
jgi:hypothetical protein